MYKLIAYEYIKEYKRYNKICEQPVNFEGHAIWFRLIDLIENGYKVVLQPVNPLDYWDDEK